MTGTIVETRHEHCGQSFKDKVLVFRGANGSSGRSAAFHMIRLSGCAPKTVIFVEMNTKAALGVMVMRRSAVTEPDQGRLMLLPMKF